MAPLKRVLFFTNSEYGQAQVHLATGFELLSYSDVEVHIAFFEELAPRTIQTSKLFEQQQNDKDNDQSLKRNDIQFHLIDYPSMKQLTLTRAPPVHPYGFFGALQAFKELGRILICWSPAQYMGIVQRCSEIFDEVQPDLVVVDSLFSQALDMCRQRLARRDEPVSEGKSRYVILSPLDFSSALVDTQPGGAVWWKYPTVCSGYPYPVPWHLIPLNIILRIRLIMAFIFSPEVQALSKARSAGKMTGFFPSFEPYRKDENYVFPCMAEIDYPIRIPSNVIGCGPITIPCPPVTESDPELASWLAKEGRRTILINLGSHITSEGNDAVELAKGLRVTLEKHPHIQVLWKLKSDFTSELKSIIGGEIADDRIRIVSWLDTDPVAILQTGRVACMVHHGGANSFFEATAEGTPQVVLPVWYDTYGFALHAEWLGIGLWASRKAAPGVEAGEFAEAVGRVVGDGVEGKQMREKVKELGLVCKKKGGRKTAASCLVEMINSNASK